MGMLEGIVWRVSSFSVREKLSYRVKSFAKLEYVMKVKLRCFGVLLALSFAFSACAHEATSSPPPDVETVLAPYIGTWRPTSSAEERNIGYITISVEGLLSGNGQGLKYRVERTIDAAVILSVTGLIGDFYQTTRALAFVRETELAGPEKNEPREILWIHWCGRLEQLSNPLDRSACSKNRYRR